MKQYINNLYIVEPIPTAMQIPFFFVFNVLLHLGISFEQTIIDPVEQPYFVVERRSSSIFFPKHLGGSSVRGFAGVRIVVSDAGKLIRTEILKIKLSGKINLTYQQGMSERTDSIALYEDFLQKHVAATTTIIKTEKRAPTKENQIYFLIRFK